MAQQKTSTETDPPPSTEAISAPPPSTVTTEPPAGETAISDQVSDGAPAVAPSETQVATKRPRAKEPEEPAKRSWGSKLTEIPVLVLLAFGIAIIIKSFLVQAFFIPSESMLPTLRVGDRVLVEKLGYRFGGPERGQVVVFEKSVFGGNKGQDLPWYGDARNFFRELLGLPTGSEEDYIKRVVAIGGDTITYRGSPRKLIINGEVVDQPYIKGGRDMSSPSLTSSDCRRLDMQKVGKGCRVPAGSIFVMGDNRSNSEDSRILGPVEEDKIVGRAFLILWPPSDFGRL
jgi:signal peptidase I